MHRVKQTVARVMSAATPWLFTDYHKLHTYDGGRIYLNPRESVNVLYRAWNVYEPSKVRLFKRIIRKGMTVVDVGVHKGYFTLLFAKLVGSQGFVLGFEPEPRNLPWIRKSIEANGYENVKIFPYALSDREGTATFYRGKGLGQGSFFKRSLTTDEILRVETRCLDNVLGELGLHADVMKVDVEGADLLVLKGAEQTLRNGCRLAMDIDVETYAEKQQIFKLLVKCGLTVYPLSNRNEPLQKLDESTGTLYAFKEPKQKC